MGFSVSASTAIIFISFLIAASTLYTAWENSYSNVQAAREDWYELRLSQVHFDVGDVSITASGSSDVSVSFKYLGQTISGTVVVLHNGTYVSSVNLGYLIPNNYYTITVTGELISAVPLTMPRLDLTTDVCCWLSIIMTQPNWPIL